MRIGYCSSDEEQLQAKTINGSRAPSEAIRAEEWEGPLTALERRVAEDRLKWRKTSRGTLGQQSSDIPRKRSTLVGQDTGASPRSVFPRGSACAAEMRYHREIFHSAPLYPFYGPPA